MTRRLSRLLMSLACVLACAAVLPSLAGAVVIGIGDNNPGTFSDPRFLALDIHAARTVVPWDVVTRRADRADLANVRAWLDAVEQAHVTPLISFGADFTNPAANYIPNLSTYTRAVKAFLHAFPQVKEYTAWNEPDWPYRSLARNPRLAASYFNELYVLCRHHCTVLAGDLFLPTSGPAHTNHAVSLLGPWLRSYLRYLHHRPAGWALHDYTEIRTHSDSQLRTLMSMTSGSIWLDETGGVLRRGHWPYKNQSANAAASDERYLLGLARRYHRISHIYHYQFIANPAAGWDSALLDQNGRPRPAYNLLYSWQHPTRSHARRRRSHARRRRRRR